MLWAGALGTFACRGGAPRVPPAPGPAPASSTEAQAIDRFVHRVVSRLGDVPGLAVAVVRDSAVVYLGAAGYRDIEAKLPATTTTPYYLASSTKSFTGMAAAILAARGTLDLDAPISRYLPELRLPAGRPADSVTMHQLLTHTMGLENDAIVIRTAYTGEHTPEQLIGLLSGSTVTSRAFRYDNLGYVVASLVLERLTRGRWQDLLQSSLFVPLGMRRTTAYMSRAGGWGLAVPYSAGADSVPRRLPQTKRDATMHAAGGVVSTAEDLSRWLSVMLTDGRLRGVQVLPPEAVREARRLQVAVDPAQTFGPFRRYGYGLGWYWGEYAGDTLIHHFGGYEGARAHVSFMPSRGLGVAVLLNASGPAAEVADLVATYAYDVLLDKPALEAHYDSALAAMAEKLRTTKERVAAQRAEMAGRENTLSRPLGTYAGTFESPMLGTLKLRPVRGRLEVSFGPLLAIAGYYTRPEALRVEFGPGRGEVLQFFVLPTGADSLEYAGYVFHRRRT
jgi:CubicO group peptidase (beta-lactamase class C family)